MGLVKGVGGRGWEPGREGRGQQPALRSWKKRRSFPFSTQGFALACECSVFWVKKGEKRWRRQKDVGGAGCKESEAQRAGFSLPGQQSRQFLIGDLVGLSRVFVVIHLISGQAAPQQVGGAGERFRARGI